MLFLNRACMTSDQGASEMFFSSVNIFGLTLIFSVSLENVYKLVIEKVILECRKELDSPIYL